MSRSRLGWLTPSAPGRERQWQRREVTNGKACSCRKGQWYVHASEANISRRACAATLLNIKGNRSRRANSSSISPVAFGMPGWRCGYDVRATRAGIWPIQGAAFCAVVSPLSQEATPTIWQQSTVAAQLQVNCRNPQHAPGATRSRHLHQQICQSISQGRIQLHCWPIKSSTWKKLSSRKCSTGKSTKRKRGAVVITSDAPILCAMINPTSRCRCLRAMVVALTALVALAPTIGARRASLLHFHSGLGPRTRQS
jgi:hypothetical protein